MANPPHSSESQHERPTSRWGRAPSQYDQSSSQYGHASSPYGQSSSQHARLTPQINQILSQYSQLQRSQLSSYRSYGAQTHNLDEILSRLLNVRNTRQQYCKLSLNEVLYVARNGMKVFHDEPFVKEVTVPCKIVGDIHGQFIDFLRLLSVCGHPPDTAYVFLGDYVDRGPNAIEVLMTLFIYKIKYPQKVVLLRGNHECPRINATYGFMTECTMRFGFSVYQAFNDSFAHMPCAAIVSHRIFCCHGGIIKDLGSIEQITDLNPRPIHDPEIASTVTELLWSDPNRTNDGWEPNFRGAGFLFGQTALNEFLDRFNFDLLARAHEVMQDGYELFFDRKAVTIFSAPNYCNQFDNAAAVMQVSADYLCSFTIVRPVSFEFPTTRIVEMCGPGLSKSPVSEPSLAFYPPESVLEVVQDAPISGIELPSERATEKPEVPSGEVPEGPETIVSAPPATAKSSVPASETPAEEKRKPERHARCIPRCVVI